MLVVAMCIASMATVQMVRGDMQATQTQQAYEETLSFRLDLGAE
jgi:hypothetical protein